MRRAMSAHVSVEHIARLQHTIAGLESFNRSVSHDLRGPLGGIASLTKLAEAALQRGDDGATQRMLEMIGFQAKSCVQLVDALLELAVVGETEVQLAPVDLGRLVEEVVQQISIGDAGPMPAIECARLPHAMADAGLLRPVLLNLIGNAVKFTRGRPSPQVEVGAHPQRDAVTVFVRDNGVGFDPACAGAVFEPFVRLHGRAFDGHGIGLSIVRRAVERHGGRVWATSARGKGANFCFTLPQPQVCA
jgi:signal transduction histidine kinase